jgi:hypothetical protein
VLFLHNYDLMHICKLLQFGRLLSSRLFVSVKNETKIMLFVVGILKCPPIDVWNETDPGVTRNISCPPGYVSGGRVHCA